MRLEEGDETFLCRIKIADATHSSCLLSSFAHGTRDVKQQIAICEERAIDALHY